MGKTSNSLTSLALQKFKKNFWGVLSFWFIVLVGLISVFAYVIAPDSSQNANQMHLSIHSKKPGFKVTMLSLPLENRSEQSCLDKLFFGEINQIEEIPISNYNIENNVLNYTEYASDGLVGQIKTLPLNIFPKGNVEDYIKEKTFVFGTDKYGRDYFSRILVGARISFFIGCRNYCSTC